MVYIIPPVYIRAQVETPTWKKGMKPFCNPSSECAIKYVSILFALECFRPRDLSETLIVKFELNATYKRVSQY